MPTKGEQLLEVELKDGEVRRFPDAPKYLFLGLVSAKSPSKFYQTIIKDRTFERVFPSGQHVAQPDNPT